VKTRLCQYDALSDGKGIAIAKQIVKGKFMGQNQVLAKHGLELLKNEYLDKINAINSDKLPSVRKRLTSIEGHFTKRYFHQLFTLLPKSLRPTKRSKFLAYDGTNNVFNLAYEALAWRVHRGVIAAKLEPFLGFLHGLQHGKPSLVCDLQELYRHIIDDFVIDFCQSLTANDFITKTARLSKLRQGKRVYLNDSQSRLMMKALDQRFETFVQIPRIKHGMQQTLNTLITEEAYLFAKYLRNERSTWNPRIV
jgi:CRISPR-associated protein Cas1